jgi:hypothetical protein
LFYLPRTDESVLTGKVKPIHTGKIPVVDKTGKGFLMKKDDQRIISGELVSFYKDRLPCSKVLEDGSIITKSLKKDDILYTSGEWKPMWHFKKRSQENKDKIGKANSIYQKGEGNSQFGSMWIKNIITRECVKIKKEDPIPEGWVKGRYNPRKINCLA